MTENTDRHWNRAQRYFEQGNLDAARVSLESVLTRNPRHLHAHLLLADIAWQDDRVRDSARHAHDAAQCVADDPEQLVVAAGALLRAGEVCGVRQCLAHPALASTRSIAVLLHMAGQLSTLGEHARALQCYERALAAGADGPDVRFQVGVHLVFNGRMAEARKQLLECVRQDPGHGRAWQELSRLGKQTQQDNHLTALAQAARAVATGSYEQASIEFARYKEHEDLGRYDEAWQALARGNAIMYARHRHDPAHTVRLFENLASLCTAQFLQPVHASNDGPQPIFILGMPRSGTTLLDRMLGNHSRITPAGELDDFARQIRWSANHCSTLDETVLARLPDIDFAELGGRYLQQTRWRADGAPFYTDKLPRNWMVAGLIAKALPHARIIHMVREPMAVCFSNFRALFADAFAHIYDLDALASHYKVYRRTMDHWHATLPGRILDVAYSDLVRDPHSTVQHVLAFCGLPSEPGIADVTRNRSAVATLSAAQVREPVHTRFLESWRHYEAHLAPLAQALKS